MNRALIVHVAGILRRLNLTGMALVVAVSGGPDSLALLQLLVSLADELDLRLHVAHLNHCLRGEASDRDAAFVAAEARRYHLPATIERRQITRDGESVEEAARRVRYQFLAEVAQHTGAAAVLTAHTLNDQAETVLMNLLRGTGLTGLSGIQLDSTLPFSDRYIRLVRPLLVIPREQIEAYCAEHGLQPRIDLTNQELGYRRNWVRHRLLPLMGEKNPEIVRSLGRLAQIVKDDLAVVEAALDGYWDRLVSGEMPGRIGLNLSLWRELPRGLQRHALRRAAAVVLTPGEVLGAALVESMLEIFATPGAGREVSLPGNAVAYSEGGYLIFTRERQEVETVPESGLAEQPQLLTIPGATELGTAGRIIAQSAQTREANPPAIHADLDARILELGQLGVRRWRPGDRMQPLGMAQEKKLQDMFVNAKIPRRQRNRIPVVVVLLPDGTQHIVWVAGVRMADWAKVTEETNWVLSVDWIAAEGW